MKALRDLRHVLSAIAQEVEVLPAVGGAVEDLERPDFEEREDQVLNEGEKVFDIVYERDSGGIRIFRPVPPLGRTESHLFRYFLDGSFRSYFLGTVLEHDRETPVHFAQVGACVLYREDHGSLRREALEVRNVLLAGRNRLSDFVWGKLEELTASGDLSLVDLTEKDIVSGVLSDFDLRNKATGKVRFAMHKLEVDMIQRVLPRLSEEAWLVVDGSLLFEPLLSILAAFSQTPPVIGVAKNFRKDPQFVFGRGPRAERYSIYRLLANLQVAHRTVAFSARGGKLVFWYVRLREQRDLDYPMMGVVKVELANPSQEPVSSELLDRISQALVAERRVTPHGLDRRWHAHLYPIFLAERMVKEHLLSREVVQQFLKWR
uniref:NurA domain-containing protein n=1 Tax=Candidatus Caldatribacterium saccharofermentans TaxID=1454753 RepID=A0A7V4TLG2_9BACT